MSDPAIIIKRYPNRKLYDTLAKKYVTLEAIEQLVRAGRDVRVVDNETGEDITNITLSNILLESQKKSVGLLPKFVFTDLIQRGGQKVVDVAKGVVGRVLSGSPELEARVRKTLDDLVAAGRIGREQAEAVAASLLRSLSERRDRMESAVSERLESTLHRLNLPTRQDLDRIRDAVRKLEGRIEGTTDSPRKKSRGAGARKKPSAGTES